MQLDPQQAICMNDRKATETTFSGGKVPFAFVKNVVQIAV